MTTFSELKSTVLTLRNEIDAVLAQDNYPVEDLAAKAVTLNKLLNTKPLDIPEGEEYPLFLTGNLQWLTTVIGKLSAEKHAIGNSILQTQRRRKAEKSYGENK